MVTGATKSRGQDCVGAQSAAAISEVSRELVAGAKQKPQVPLKSFTPILVLSKQEDDINQST